MKPVTYIGKEGKWKYRVCIARNGYFSGGTLLNADIISEHYWLKADAEKRFSDVIKETDVQWVQLMKGDTSLIKQYRLDHQPRSLRDY